MAVERLAAGKVSSAACVEDRVGCGHRPGDLVARPEQGANRAGTQPLRESQCHEQASSRTKHCGLRSVFGRRNYGRHQDGGGHGLLRRHLHDGGDGADRPRGCSAVRLWILGGLPNAWSCWPMTSRSLPSVWGCWDRARLPRRLRDFLEADGCQTSCWIRLSGRHPGAPLLEDHGLDIVRRGYRRSPTS